MIGFAKKKPTGKSIRVKEQVNATNTKGFAHVSLMDKPSNIVTPSRTASLTSKC